MKFERLRLTGFKSFCDSVEFRIEPGLTGVVGPNGCGKSNLVEALRWVMGESSFKNMRGSGMEDVIFAGSTRRPSRNIAEVGLLLDNSERRAPAAFNDTESIEVTRRIERDQGSTYRVNGKEVRARDVQLLFADASTGARSPSLVRQGQIGEIIAARPQARRLILEEAAGVSGLHSRRHEAELRLKGADDNLIRVEDVLKQIDAQVDSLKRQARQANRYRDLAGQHPSPGGARPPHRLARPRGGVRRGAPAARRRPDRSRRAHPRPGRGRAPAGARRRRPAELARGGGAPRRGPASDRARPRDARSGGEARPGARGRARAPHRPVRRRCCSARKR